MINAHEIKTYEPLDTERLVALAQHAAQASLFHQAGGLFAMADLCRDRRDTIQSVLATRLGF